MKLSHPFVAGFVMGVSLLTASLFLTGTMGIRRAEAQSAAPPAPRCAQWEVGYHSTYHQGWRMSLGWEPFAANGNAGGSGIFGRRCIAP